jgi:hypothetical protein
MQIALFLNLQVFRACPSFLPEPFFQRLRFAGERGEFALRLRRPARNQIVTMPFSSTRIVSGTLNSSVA